MKLLTFLSLGLLAIASTTVSAQVQPPMGSSRGPVLCIWSITVTQIAVAEKCFKGQNPEFVEALRWSIGKMDEFILRNSNTKQMELEARKIKLSGDVLKNVKVDPAGACVPGQPLLVFYPKQIPPRAEIETATNRLLEFNRRPEMKPCI
jgi:hypothetical protein